VKILFPVNLPCGCAVGLTHGGIGIADCGRHAQAITTLATEGPLQVPPGEGITNAVAARLAALIG
jgi:hypothetical protein